MTQPWLLWQYQTIVDDFMTNCCQGMREKLEQRIDLLAQLGNECRHPVTDFVEDGLFELRARSGNIQARLLFYFAPGRTIVFVHAFYKPGRQIDPREIRVARNNRERIIGGLERANAINYTN